MLVVGATLIRLAAHLLLNGIVFGGAIFHPDSQLYLHLAQQTRASWVSGALAWPDGHGYAGIIALIQLFTFSERAGIDIVNLLVGAGAVVPAYAIGMSLSGRRAALWAGSVVMVSPTMVYYSTQILRDIWFIVALLWMTWAFIAKASVKVRVGTAAISGCIFIILGRPLQLLFLALVTIVVFALIRKRWAVGSAVIVVMATLNACWLGLLQGPIARIAQVTAPPSHVDFFPGGLPVVPLRSCADFPSSLASGFLTGIAFPFPWSVDRWIEFAFAIDVVFSLAVIAFGAPAILASSHGFSTQARLRALAIAALAWTTVLAITVPVAAPFLRWRVGGMAILMVLAAASRSPAASLKFLWNASSSKQRPAPLAPSKEEPA